MAENYHSADPRVLKLKAIIKKLHHGASPDEVQDEFAHEFKYVSGSEIAAMEMQLVEDGLDVTEIIKLCDVHARMFYDNIFEIHSDKVKDHPLEEYQHENKVIQSFVQAHLTDEILAGKITSYAGILEVLPHVIKLADLLEQHYSKKEQRIFPLLEDAGITTIPQVMWGVHDEIRDKFKELKATAADSAVDPAKWLALAKLALDQALDMINKEENILFTILKENLTTEHWDSLKAVSASQNYHGPLTQGKLPTNGKIHLPSGEISVNELNILFNTLPFDITFVDKDDRVAYVSQGKHRIFDRPLTVIGREVRFCHPPKSLDRVEKIISDFRQKKSDHEHFWIHFKGMYVYIQYFALYDEAGNYLGVIEVSQDLTPLQAITGEKRLAD